MSGPGPSLRDRVDQLLLWRVWERLLEIEFVDRSVALAGKAFVSFLRLVIVAAFVPEAGRESIVTTLIDRLGLAGEALDVTRGAFDSSSDIREATGVLGLVLTVFFAMSFTTALSASTSGVATGRSVMSAIVSLVVGVLRCSWDSPSSSR